MLWPSAYHWLLSPAAHSLRRLLAAVLRKDLTKQELETLKSREAELRTEEKKQIELVREKEAASKSREGDLKRAKIAAERAVKEKVDAQKSLSRALQHWETSDDSYCSAAVDLERQLLSIQTRKKKIEKMKARVKKGEVEKPDLEASYETLRLEQAKLKVQRNEAQNKTIEVRAAARAAESTKNSLQQRVSKLSSSIDKAKSSSSVDALIRKALPAQIAEVATFAWRCIQSCLLYTSDAADE